MPYIVCVNRPGCLPEQSPLATATIDEVRRAARAALDDSLPQDRSLNSDEQRADRWARLAIQDMIDGGEGGTITLPDGYVVDVRRVTINELAALCGKWNERGSSDFSTAAIIDAYNEQG